MEVGISDAAARLGCSPEYARRLARRGRLSARRVGRTWLVDAAALAAGEGVDDDGAAGGEDASAAVGGGPCGAGRTAGPDRRPGEPGA
ncbi:helix-turn-helix domain-containing protein [Streptomyces griseoluteus]|uniref:helix-turn-helix domain-containing protein n=1 Tax=Streptomyces griseoluteus TaxID=29306 RepID=UPI0034089E09